MRVQKEVPEPFRKLYEEAMEFRFQPCYSNYLEKDLVHWMEELWEIFDPIHLACERVRLAQPGLTWAGYFDRSIVHSLLDEGKSVKACLRKARNLALGSAYPLSASFLVRLGCACGSWREILPLLFPTVAYRPHDPTLAKVAQHILGTPSAEMSALVKGYLRMWGIQCDKNFPNVLRALNVHLDSSTT